jgi:cell division protein FtsN
MKNIFCKILIVFFAINLASCSYFKKTNQPAKTRIVSLDGQYREIVTKTPEMNAKILASQVNLSEEKKKFAEMMKGAENKKIVPIAPDAKNKIAENAVSVDAENAPLVEVASGDSAKVQQIFGEDSAKKDGGVQEVDLSDSAAPMKGIKKPIFIKKGQNKKGKMLVTQTAAASDVAAEPENEAPVASAKKKGLFVQVGSFQDMGNAKSTLATMSKFHKGFVETSNGEKTIYRVLLGPIAGRKKANLIVVNIKKTGQDAIVVRNR